MSVFTGGGEGQKRPLTGVFVLSADFSEYGVPLVGVCYTFSESHLKGLFGDVWVEGRGGHIFENFGRYCGRFGFFCSVLVW